MITETLKTLAILGVQDIGAAVTQTAINVAASEAARDAALIQAGVYTTEAAGRADVADGQSFKVQGSGNVAAYEYRRTNAGASVLIATYPSSAYVATKADATHGKNLFNPNASGVLTDYIVSITTGEPVSTAGFTLSDYMLVSPSTAYAVSSGRQMAWYDSSRVFISGVASAGGVVTTVTSPINAAYLRASVSAASLATYQVEQGSSSTAYEAYALQLTSALAAGAVSTTKILDSAVTAAKLASNATTTSKIADKAVSTTKLADAAVTPSKTNFLQIGKNKFNKTAATIGYYCSNTGSIIANATYDVSDYIPVIAGTQYVCNGSGFRFSCYFDENFNVVAGGASANTTTFTPPTGAVYIRVTTYHTELATFQLEIGATATAYTDYQYVMSLDSGVPITATSTLVAPVLVMPPYIFGVQGRECNLYLDNLHVGDSTLFNHDVTNTVVTGSQQRERWTWTPTGVQSTGTLTVSAYDKTSGTALVSATTNQRAAASTAGSGTTKVINTIGDSLINAATITQTVIDIAAGDVMGVSFIGTRGTSPNKHEGRSGWKISDYATVGRTFYSFTVSGIVTTPAINSTVYTNNGSTFLVQETDLTAGSGTIICERTVGTNAPSASGTLTKSSGTGDATISFSAYSTVSGNPFWISGALNYPQYLVNNSLATPDWVLIHLGINDAFSYTTDATVIAAAIAAFDNLDLLITSIKAAGAGVKVGLMLPTPPANQDGFGAGYGTGQTAWRDKRNIMLWAKELIARYTGQEASRIYLVPSNTALDTANGYPLATSATVNSRSSVMVQRQNNGVHPDTSGYQQIGDALWAFLKCNA